MIYDLSISAAYIVSLRQSFEYYLENPVSDSFVD